LLNQPDLNTLSKNDQINHFLLIRRFDLRTTRSGSDFLSTELGDKTASLNANVWEGFTEVAARGKVGDVVKVAGTIEEYQGSLQIRVSSIRLAKSSDEVSSKDFLPQSKRNLKEMKDEFNKRINNNSNKYLNTLLTQIFNSERLELFCTAPAGKSWHHAYIHGLIEHTLEIIKICELMCEFHQELNKDLLIAGAMLHDIGKLGIPHDLLNKPAPLTEEETQHMQRHAEVGYKICLPLKKVLGPALDVIRHHHEKLDGSGYPDGLRGDKITTEARIMAVTDMFDALISDRPYREGLTKEQVIDILRQEVRDGKLDRDVVEHLVEIVT